MLLLNGLQGIVNPKINLITKNLLLSSSKYFVKLLQQFIGSIWSTVNDWIIVLELDSYLLAFEELSKMLPVVDLLVQLKTVVILVHLNIIRVISEYKLSKNVKRDNRKLP